MKITGYASTSHMDKVRHVVHPQAFTESIMHRGLTGPSGVRLLAFHDSHKPLGRITKLEPRNKGLYMEADIDEGLSYGKDLAVATKAAGGLNFSVGFMLLDADIDVAPDGDEFLHILKGDLFEVSVVVFPMNDGAAMTEVKAPDEGPLADLTATLTRMKLIAEELNR